jgi:hypothetical protein
VTNDLSGASQEQLDRIDFSVPHSARIWNYWLGGKDNYQVDRVIGDQVADVPGHTRGGANVQAVPAPRDPLPDKGG